MGRRISKIKCDICNGLGKIEANCYKCRGKGGPVSIECPDCVYGVHCCTCHGDKFIEVDVCPECGGNGTEDVECWVCSGVGEVDNPNYNGS